MAYTSTHRHPGEGEELYTADATVTVKCRAAHTGGGYEVFEIDAARGPVVPAHREPWAKAFYVLHGRMAVQAGEASYELGPGAFLTVPPGTANSFEVFSPSVKFLAFSLGTGMGDFFADVDRAAERDASLANLASQLQELATRHHVTFAGPPLVTL